MTHVVTEHDGSRTCDCRGCCTADPTRRKSPVTLRYARNGNTLHLAAVGDNQSVCLRDVGHYFGGTTTIVNGRRVYGSRAMKLCKRCMPVAQAAIADGLIAFVAWASAFADVTDEQIRELRNEVFDTNNLTLSGLCVAALGVDGGRMHVAQNDARARCAKIIRARGAA